MGKMSVMIIDNNPENERNCVKFGENEKKKLATRLHNFIIIWNIFGIFAVIEKKAGNGNRCGAHGIQSYTLTHTKFNSLHAYVQQENQKLRAQRRPND